MHSVAQNSSYLSCQTSIIFKTGLLPREESQYHPQTEGNEKTFTQSYSTFLDYVLSL